MECREEYSSSDSSFADFACRCFRSSACASACAFFVASKASSLRSLPSDPSASLGWRNSDRASCNAGLGATCTTGVAGAAAVGNAMTLMESPGPNSGDSDARRRYDGADFESVETASELLDLEDASFERLPGFDFEEECRWEADSGRGFDAEGVGSRVASGVDLATLPMVLSLRRAGARSWKGDASAFNDFCEDISSYRCSRLFRASRLQCQIEP